MNKLPINIQKAIDVFIKESDNLLGDRIKKIILYGSYARGDYKNDSDIDIMILTDLNENEIVKYREKIIDISYDIECENNFDIEINPLLKNVDKFNYWLDALPFYINVQKEGVVISESESV